MQACTIVARNYLAHARVLARSFRDHHPDGRFYALVVDDVGGEVDAGEEPFDVVRPEELALDVGEFHRMAMIYEVTELATAVKPWFLEFLLERVDDVAYFDPDIQIFDALDDLSALARANATVLVPHATEPIPRDGHVPSEETILRAGIYNLGFVGVGQGARPLLEWWRERLARDCILDPEGGQFVDQRWIDFVPALFEHVIVRDPGINVAYWNLPTRSLELRAGRYEVNGGPLRFFHFSGFDPLRPDVLSKHQGLSPRISPADHPALERLCAEYAEQLFANGFHECAAAPYAYGRLADGTPISTPMRRVYRRALVDAETAAAPAPPDPFVADDLPELATWLAGSNGAGPATGLNVAGFLRAELGIGEAARRILAGVRASGLPYVTLTYGGTTLSRQEHPQPEAGSQTAVYETNLICVNADTMSAFAEHVGPDFFRGRHSIGVWWWEVPLFPDALRDGLELVDEIWVGSDYTAQAIAPATSKPVLKVPIPVEAPEVDAGARSALGLPEGFLFLFSFDFLSVFERKNPLGVVEAYARAFDAGDGAVLVLKSINGDKAPVQLEQLRAAAAERDDVVVVDGYLSPRDKDSLMTSCDCYVSLHRSEGFGLTMAEAMAHGKPVIATGYSGNLEFMDEENSYLVPYGLTSIPRGCGPYPEGAEWAEPDLGRAAELMREVFEQPDEARGRGELARTRILSEHAPERTGDFIRERLREIARERPAAQARVPSFETLFAGPASPLERALARLARSPEEALDGPAGRSPRGVVRRLLGRALWPYLKEQRELDRALVDTIRELEAQVKDLTELVGRSQGSS